MSISTSAGPRGGEGRPEAGAAAEVRHGFGRAESALRGEASCRRDLFSPAPGGVQAGGAVGTGVERAGGKIIT